MNEIATWLFEHGEKIGGYVILLGATYAFMFGHLWSRKAVETRIADFERREAKLIADFDAREKNLRSDCEYSRTAHERLLAELERAISANQVLARKATASR